MNVHLNINKGKENRTLTPFPVATFAKKNLLFFVDKPFGER